jgi:hypothetical protein
MANRPAICLLILLLLSGCRCGNKLPPPAPMLVNATAVLDHVPSATVAAAIPALDKAGIHWTESCEHTQCSLFVSARDRNSALRVIRETAAAHVPK